MCDTKHSNMKIDDCLKNLIKIIQQAGFKTRGSCCGHRKYNMTIIVEHEGSIFDLISLVEIPRKKKFYKKDAEGFYFIPEVEEAWSSR